MKSEINSEYPSVEALREKAKKKGAQFCVRIFRWRMQ